MQDSEVLILEELERNSDITQRELSEKTGLSLGMVNLLLKKFIINKKYIYVIKYIQSFKN